MRITLFALLYVMVVSGLMVSHIHDVSKFELYLIEMAYLIAGFLVGLSKVNY